MKALIVDESGLVSRRLRPSLEEEGYCVDDAITRGEARWLAGESATDVVVVCSARPGVHDVPTILALREDGETAPILVLAKRADGDDIVAALDAGADDVVVSPVSFAEVAARLRALRRRGGQLDEDDVVVGTLRLDRRTHAAIRETETGAVAVELTPREVALLDILMRHPGQVLSRTRLLEHIWGAEPEVSSNIVDQVVSRLRAKLDRPFGCRDVRTVRGVGYRFGDGRGAARSLSAARDASDLPAQRPAPRSPSSRHQASLGPRPTKAA